MIIQVSVFRFALKILPSEHNLQKIIFMMSLIEDALQTAQVQLHIATMSIGLV